MRTLKQIMDEIMVKNVEAAADPTTFDPRVVSSVEGAARAARLALQDLTLEYKEALIPAVKTIAVTGKDSQEFANVAKYVTESLTFDYHLPIRRIIEDIRGRGFGPSFTNQEYFSFLSILGQMKVEYGFFTDQVPRFSMAEIDVYMQPVESAAKAIVFNNFKGSLCTLAFRHEVQKAALESKFAGKILPVILYNYEPDHPLTQNLMSEPVEVVEIPEGVEIREYTLKKLNEIKNKLNPKKKKEEAKKQEENNE